MKLVILQPIMDALRDFHGTPPLWIFLNVIIGLPYLQKFLGEGLSLGKILAFEGPRDPIIGVVPFDFFP
jgi:hypothetical protein